MCYLYHILDQILYHIHITRYHFWASTNKPYWTERHQSAIKLYPCYHCYIDVTKNRYKVIQQSLPFAMNNLRVPFTNWIYKAILDGIETHMCNFEAPIFHFMCAHKQFIQYWNIHISWIWSKIVAKLASNIDVLWAEMIPQWNIHKASNHVPLSQEPRLLRHHSVTICINI